MPRLQDLRTFHDHATLAVNRVLAQEGIPGLTLRRVGLELNAGASTLSFHFGSRERLVSISAMITCRWWLDDIASRLDDEGLAAFLPYDDELVHRTRAWLAWQELWRTIPQLVELFDEALDAEHELLRQALGSAQVDDRVTEVAAVIDGLRWAATRPSRPLPLKSARDLLKRNAARILLQAA